MESVFNMRLLSQEAMFQHPTLIIVEKIFDICNEHKDVEWVWNEELLLSFCCAFSSLGGCVQRVSDVHSVWLCDFSPHHCAVVKSAWQWRCTLSGFSFHKVRGRSPWQHCPQVPQPIPRFPSEESRAQGRFLCHQAEANYHKNCFWYRF